MRKWLLLSGLCCCVNLFAADSDGDGLRRAGRYYTLNKSEKHYSPTTMYLDYAISDELFHWQSQSTTSTESATGKRYLNGSSTVLLFVRENKSADGISSSYCFLGPAKYVSHSGSRPINITWKLLYKMPARLCRMTERMAIA